ncbi:WD repeat-containing protein 6 [Coniothyrium glycines]
MSPILRHECTRAPITAAASCAGFLVAAEGPFLRFYSEVDACYISSQRIFKSQAVHGITVCPQQSPYVIRLVVWGGRLVRALEVDIADKDTVLDKSNLLLSDIAAAPDWILDLSPCPSNLIDGAVQPKAASAAVTAHNALLSIEIDWKSANAYPKERRLNLSIEELTSSSRSILYSAHLLWDSATHILVAAGTAFGEIIYWSWTRMPELDAVVRVHRVFLGHEGSIFGVRISKTLSPDCSQGFSRVIASCSDDRTVRLWDVSNLDLSTEVVKGQTSDTEGIRTRHTGFNNETFDFGWMESSECLATGWGHASRVWAVRFLEGSSAAASTYLVSTGEDASVRTWEVIRDKQVRNSLPNKLIQLDSIANHSGKNLWSSTVYQNGDGLQKIVCGGADSKITISPIIHKAQPGQHSTHSMYRESSVQSTISLIQHESQEAGTYVPQDKKVVDSKSEFFRSYCFVDAENILLTTNAGSVLLGQLQTKEHNDQHAIWKSVTHITHLDEFRGYSVCTSSPLPGVAFAAGANGNIYMYRHDRRTFTKIHSAIGKVGGLHSANVQNSATSSTIVLLVSLVGQAESFTVYVDTSCELQTSRVVSVPVSDSLNGSITTAMSFIEAGGNEYLFLGFRRGSIAAYIIQRNDLLEEKAVLFHTIDKAHDGETVTSLLWSASAEQSQTGHLASVGRDGRLVVHHLDLVAKSASLLNCLSLPIGPNIEGLYRHKETLFVHGFSSKKWVLYNVTTEEVVMSVETGGAHRSWTYHPGGAQIGGTLVWTRASSLHMYRQSGMHHVVLRAGGHGREIKALAVSANSSLSATRGCLIATGAEDTDIKIFQYVNGDLICRKTLRKHTTGIQHLQWSADGSYLFSSGGCEEFYIWRVHDVSLLSTIGVVCEHVYSPESEQSDLRIMSFDIASSGSITTVAMVCSDSSFKVFQYDSTATVRWRSVAKGIYFTSCLTQCLLLSATTAMTIGTDGHAVNWFLPQASSVSSMDGDATVVWQNPTKLHQNSSKTTATHQITDTLLLVASGGDDGSLALMVVPGDSQSNDSASTRCSAVPPILLSRAHASAVTACIIACLRDRTYLMTSGNDEWIRLWEVSLEEEVSGDYGVRVRRCARTKTNVADVSSMAVVEADDKAVKVLVCGVGMEVIRLEGHDSRIPQ